VGFLPFRPFFSLSEFHPSAPLDVFGRLFPLTGNNNPAAAGRALAGKIIFVLILFLTLIRYKDFYL
jgi:hypothetical protein